MMSVDFCVVSVRLSVEVSAFSCSCVTGGRFLPPVCDTFFDLEPETIALLFCVFDFKNVFDWELEPDASMLLFVCNFTAVPD